MIMRETLAISPVSLSSSAISVSGEILFSSIPLSLHCRVELFLPLASEVAKLLAEVLSQSKNSKDDFLDDIRREIISFHMRLSRDEGNLSEERKSLVHRITLRFPEISDLSWAEICDTDVFTKDIGNISCIRSSRGTPESPVFRVLDFLRDFTSTCYSAEVLLSAAPALQAVGRDLWAREIIDHASSLVREGKASVSRDLLEIAKSLFTGNYSWNTKFPITPFSSPSCSPRTIETIISDLRQQREARLKARAVSRIQACGISTRSPQEVFQPSSITKTTQLAAPRTASRTICPSTSGKPPATPRNTRRSPVQSGVRGEFGGENEKSISNTSSLGSKYYSLQSAESVSLSSRRWKISQRKPQLEAPEFLEEQVRKLQEWEEQVIADLRELEK